MVVYLKGFFGRRVYHFIKVFVYLVDFEDEEGI